MKFKFSALLMLLVFFITFSSCEKKDEETTKDRNTQILTSKRWKAVQVLIDGRNVTNPQWESFTYKYNTDGTLLYSAYNDPGTVRYWEWVDEEATQIRIYYFKNDPNSFIQNMLVISPEKVQYRNPGYIAPQTTYEFTLAPAQ